MTQEERKILRDVLAGFEKHENDCFQEMEFLEGHNFNIQREFVDFKRQAYHQCFRELNRALLLLDSMEKPERERIVTTVLDKGEYSVITGCVAVSYEDGKKVKVE